MSQYDGTINHNVIIYCIYPYLPFHSSPGLCSQEVLHLIQGICPCNKETALQFFFFLPFFLAAPCNGVENILIFSWCKTSRSFIPFCSVLCRRSELCLVLNYMSTGIITQQVSLLKSMEKKKEKKPKTLSSCVWPFSVMPRSSCMQSKYILLLISLRLIMYL